MALGRIGSAVIAPNESLDLHIFIDAGGQADSTRVWGGLACDAHELSWIDTELSRLKALLPQSLEKDGELKGKHVPIEIAKESGRKFHQEDRRILFLGEPVPQARLELAPPDKRRERSTRRLCMRGLNRPAIQAFDRARPGCRRRSAEFQQV